MDLTFMNTYLFSFLDMIFRLNNFAPFKYVASNFTLKMAAYI